MHWKDIIKSQMSGNTEWWGIGEDKVKQFDTVDKARYRMKILNAKLPDNEPKWEIYKTFGKPMLKRVWPE
jgi:hypothetical protein